MFLSATRCSKSARPASVLLYAENDPSQARNSLRWTGRHRSTCVRESSVCMLVQPLQCASPATGTRGLSTQSFEGWTIPADERAPQSVIFVLPSESYSQAGQVFRWTSPTFRNVGAFKRQPVQSVNPARIARRQRNLRVVESRAVANCGAQSIASARIGPLRLPEPSTAIWSIPSYATARHRDRVGQPEAVASWATPAMASPHRKSVSCSDCLNHVAKEHQSVHLAPGASATVCLASRVSETPLPIVRSL